MKLYSEAAQRNQTPIVEVLSKWLPRKGRALEIASGSGQHVVRLAQEFPEIQWQPSDLTSEALTSIEAWKSESELGNIETPQPIDVCKPLAMNESFDAIVCINMIHIAPPEATQGLFRVAKEALDNNGLLYLYGPFLFSDRPTAPSNLEFDRWLKVKNKSFGIRDFDSLLSLAKESDLEHQASIEMPANNFSLVFKKKNS